jgi:hypothetical protein
VNENILPERPIHQTEREAEEALHKRNPLKSCDLLIRNRENDKSLKYNNFDRCDSQFNIVEVVAKELLGQKHSPYQRGKSEEKQEGGWHWIIDTKG